MHVAPCGATWEGAKDARRVFAATRSPGDGKPRFVGVCREGGAVRLMGKRVFGMAGPANRTGRKIRPECRS